MSTEPKRMVITGATGFIGSHLCGHFSRLGWDVIGTFHTALPIATTSQWLHWDLKDAPPPALAEADVVLHLACACIAEPAPRSEEAQSPDVRATLALHAQWHAVHSKPAPQQKFVLFSSRASHPHAANQYGRVKHHCEGICDQPDDIIIRPGVVVGEGSRGVYSTLRQILRRLPVVPVPASRSRFHPTTLADLEAALHDAIAAPAGQSAQMLAPAAAEDMTLRQFLEFICERESLKRPALFEIDARLPATLLAGLARIFPRLRYLEERFCGLLPPTR
ncbi:NAD-dependent epimerase/dehydratase family protein [Devosia sp.]|uniref:NAD-dependent epimerase/dehydratase family protein n=1 Tax=Devosia sp. TaxID=1871048 RepID=UPI003265991D